MARKESCAGTTLGTAVEDMCAFCEGTGRAALLVDLGDGRLRHACGGDAEEKTASERANAQPQQRAVVVAYLYSIVRHCSPSRCGGRAAGIPPIVVVEMPHGITIATSRPCGAAFVAELPHL